jgi:hypothetical protein
MKRASNVIGCLAAAFVLITLFFKINHMPGSTPVMILTGGFLSIYFPMYILSRFTDEETGITPSWVVISALIAAFLNLGIVFKLQHWPGASILLTLSLAAFSLLFIPLLLRYKLTEVPAENKLMNLCGGLGLAFTALGLLFKVQHWPFAVMLLLAGVSFQVLGYLPLYLKSEKKEQNLRNTFFVIVMGGILIMYQAGILQKISQVPGTVNPVSQPVALVQH